VCSQVRILSTIDHELLKPGSAVALHKHSNALVDVLPPEADSSISMLGADEKPDVTCVCISCASPMPVFASLFTRICWFLAVSICSILLPPSPSLRRVHARGHVLFSCHVGMLPLLPCAESTPSCSSTLLVLMLIDLACHRVGALSPQVCRHWWHGHSEAGDARGSRVAPHAL
jgi:hypothetical protein